MNTEYLTPKDITEFEQKYPAAAAFLRYRGLVNEKASLQLQLAYGVKYLDPRRVQWIKQRLEELREVGNA